ncbi:hypothetical protein Tsp_01984 [Trichinella spiralis]|uniref:hypothetical protein n=1 Tax=Trichinella spiralis TaxID=6334 RepID=UPI0001EFB8E8|nr:hypothetical protein Tsp_01984 [Trichinella spiralis]
MELFVIYNLHALDGNEGTAGRTVRLACEATGELNFKCNGNLENSFHFIQHFFIKPPAKWTKSEQQLPYSLCLLLVFFCKAAAKRQPQQKPGTNEDGEIDVTALDSAVAKRSIATRCFPTRTPKSNKIRQ